MPPPDQPQPPVVQHFLDIKQLLPNNGALLKCGHSALLNIYGLAREHGGGFGGRGCVRGMCEG